MSVELPRGFEIKSDIRVRRSLCSGDDWQIVSTSNRGYAIAITQTLFDHWCRMAELSFFDMDENTGLYICASSPEFLISSLSEGPFPNNSNQIYAFSTVFGRFRDEHPDLMFSDAVYFEEYGLLLPLNKDADRTDMLNAYGKWLTGGVVIPGNDIAQLGAFLSWMPQEVLVKSAHAAHMIDEEDIKTKTKEKAEPSKAVSSSAPEETFRLLGRPDLEKFFNDKIVDIIRHEEEYKRMGINFPGATILYGPPGCGKTYAVDRLAEYLDWPRFNIEAGTVASPFIHDTSKKISQVFSQAISAAPSILVIDEMEAFLSDRANSGYSGSHHIEEVGEFLRRIPEAIDHHVLIFAMTNMINHIDPAILRRGRFDHIIEVKMASVEEIESLLISRFNELPISDEVDPHFIAVALDGHPLSDVAYIIKEAGTEAVRAHKEKMDKESFDSALASLPNTKKKNTRKIGF